MTPPGPTHAQAVSRLNRWSVENTDAKRVAVRVQDPIEIPEYDSAPQPDIIWAKAKDYSKQHPQPRYQSSDELAPLASSETYLPIGGLFSGRL
jgi:hypothetical protein